MIQMTTFLSRLSVIVQIKIFLLCHVQHWSVGGDAKQPKRILIQFTHASRNACIYGHSNASGNACISRRSIYTLATDRPKKKVRLVVDLEVHAPDEPQQAPLIMASGRAWNPGVYRALRLLGKTLDVAWERAFVPSLTLRN
jgi:hypothetical protein